MRLYGTPHLFWSFEWPAKSGYVNLRWRWLARLTIGVLRLFGERIR